ncbi:MAG: response regulator [Pseudomonadota bacterium]
MNRVPYKILIVEDSAEDRYALTRKLQSSSGQTFSITEARNGSEGMVQCLASPPDCILLDYQLPDLNGVEFIASLHAELDGKLPAIVMLTGLGNEKLAVEAMKAGAQDYLVKGLDQERIYQAINTAIESVSQRRTLEAQELQVQTLSQDREKLIQELEQRANELAQIDQRKDIFLATLAHELRNPLAPIRSAMDILKYEQAHNKRVTELRQVVERQVQHLTMLVNDRTDVARISSGKVVLKRKPIALADVIARSVEICSDLLACNHHTVELSQPAETVLLDADPVRIVQILVNILANACKYTLEPGTIRLEARVMQELVIFTITDPGIGMAESVLPTIFGIFTQIQPPEGHKQEGLGIGLSLAKQFAEMHGGTIVPDSKGPNQGSVFTVSLPVVIQSPSAATMAAAVTATSTSLQKAVTPRLVMVVDDNADAADLLEMLFLTAGFSVIKAYSGTEAIESALKFKPEIVVMDLGMPGMNGFEAIRQIRQQPNGSAITAVALTGWDKDATRTQTVEAGFDHHLVKPIDFEKLNQLLQPRG